MATFGQRLYKRTVEVGVGVIGQPTLTTWRDLQVAFKVERSDKRSPNKSTVRVWNLSASSRALLETAGAVVSLRVSYGDANPAIVALGDVQLVSHQRAQEDTITTLHLGDGERAFTLAKINEAFGPGVTNLELLSRAVAAMGLAVGHVASITPVVYTQGYSATGMARDLVDEVVEAANATWSIQDNAIQVVNDDEGTNEPAVFLSPETGLVGSPERLKGKGKRPKKSKGIKATALLNPLIRPRSYVLVESSFISGYYLVKSVRHEGESRGASFYTQFEATEMASPPAPTATTAIPPGFAAATDWVSDVIGF